MTIEPNQKQAVLAVARDCHDLLSSQKWATTDFNKVYGVLNWLTNLESGIVDELRSAEPVTTAEPATSPDTQPAAN